MQRIARFEFVAPQKCSECLFLDIDYSYGIIKKWECFITKEHLSQISDTRDKYCPLLIRKE